MGIVVSLIILIICFVLMAKIVDDFFIKSLDNIAETLKLTPSVSGASLMAFGTSAPEISTTMFAIFLVGASPDTGLGAVVGSAIFQILVVIGFATLVKTTYADWKSILRDGIFYCITILLLILIVNDRTITAIEAGVLVLTYLIYLVTLFTWSRYFKEKKMDMSDVIDKGIEDEAKMIDKTPLRYFTVIMKPVNALAKFVPDVDKKRNRKYTWPVFLFSLASIGFLSYWLVVAGENLALGLGIPKEIVALTILAGGTSVPEVIGSAIVSREGRGGMAISNAIGSNVFDILMSLGLPVLIYTLINGDLENIAAANINSSIFLLFATMITVLVLMGLSRFKLGRGFGLILIGTYVIYVIAAYTGLLNL
jgi:K+-dependent Na+/Ca+ exchanger-like protein